MTGAPEVLGAAGADERVRAARLRELGVADAALAELVAYTANPYASISAADLPLADEPHVEAWRDYAREAARDGAAATLRRRLVQLRFPIAAGMSADAAFRAAVLRGVVPADGAGVDFADPAGLTIEVHPTPAGAVPVVVARDRRDFVSLVRSLTARNEPVAVPEAMGACLVKGLVNQDRVARHRARWQAAGGDVGETAWGDELRRLAADKASYQDRVIVLSTGPYSAVPAAQVGRSEAEWSRESLAVRRDHECFHYLTLRLCGLVRSNLLDEIVADAAGLLGAYGTYDAALARRFLGVDANGELRPDARLRVYRGELSDQAFAALVPLAAAAVAGVARVLSQRPVLGDGERGTLLLALASAGIEGLASADAVDHVGQRVSPA